MSQIDVGNVLGTVGGFIPGLDVFDAAAGLYRAFNPPAVTSPPPGNSPVAQPQGPVTMNASCYWYPRS